MIQLKLCQHYTISCDFTYQGKTPELEMLVNLFDVYQQGGTMHQLYIAHAILTNY